jgi:hypothetical protein
MSMRKFETDRTDEVCPFCREGKLYPTGKAFRYEDVDRSITNEIGGSNIEYECDQCHEKTNAAGVGVGTSANTSVTATVTRSDESS